jgi:hypothetical protein
LSRKIDESIVPAPRPPYDEKDIWTSPYAALDLLSGRDSQIDKLDQLLEGMSFLQ